MAAWEDGGKKKKSWMCKSQKNHLHIKSYLASREQNNIIKYQMRAHVLDTIFDHVFSGFCAYSLILFPSFKTEQSQVTTWTPQGI